MNRIESLNRGFRHDVIPVELPIPVIMLAAIVVPRFSTARARDDNR